MTERVTMIMAAFMLVLVTLYMLSRTLTAVRVFMSSPAVRQGLVEATIFMSRMALQVAQFIRTTMRDQPGVVRRAYNDATGATGSSAVQHRAITHRTMRGPVQQVQPEPLDEQRIIALMNSVQLEDESPRQDRGLGTSWQEYPPDNAYVVLARLIKAKLLTETKAIEIGLGATRSSKSKKYLAHRDRLQAHLAIVGGDFVEFRKVDPNTGEYVLNKDGSVAREYVRRSPKTTTT